jgi:hypothetical protein
MGFNGSTDAAVSAVAVRGLHEMIRPALPVFLAVVAHGGRPKICITYSAHANPEVYWLVSGLSACYVDRERASCLNRHRVRVVRTYGAGVSGDRAAKGGRAPIYKNGKRSSVWILPVQTDK